MGKNKNTSSQKKETKSDVKDTPLVQENSSEKKEEQKFNETIKENKTESNTEIPAHFTGLTEEKKCGKKHNKVGKNCFIKNCCKSFCKSVYMSLILSCVTIFIFSSHMIFNESIEKEFYKNVEPYVNAEYEEFNYKVDKVPKLELSFFDTDAIVSRALSDLSGTVGLGQQAIEYSNKVLNRAISYEDQLTLFKSTVDLADAEINSVNIEYSNLKDTYDQLVMEQADMVKENNELKAKIEEYIKEEESKNILQIEFDKLKTLYTDIRQKIEENEKKEEEEDNETQLLENKGIKQIDIDLLKNNNKQLATFIEGIRKSNLFNDSHNYTDTIENFVNRYEQVNITEYINNMTIAFKEHASAFKEQASTFKEQASMNNEKFADKTKDFVSSVLPEITSKISSYFDPKNVVVYIAFISIIISLIIQLIKDQQIIKVYKNVLQLEE